MEVKFQNVIRKIMVKMSQIQQEATKELGAEATNQMLLPFASILKPITNALPLEEESKTTSSLDVIEEAPRSKQHVLKASVRPAQHKL